MQGIQDNSIFRKHKKFLENPKPLGFEHREETTFIFNFLSPQFFIKMLSMFLRPKSSYLVLLLGRKNKGKEQVIYEKKVSFFSSVIKIRLLKISKI